MESKFHILSVGQHFEWEGKHYVKTTPLIATQVPDGGQKFMPRAAMVKVLGVEGTSQPIIETPAILDGETVRNAISHYHQRCMQISEACIPQEGNIITQVQSELEQIYRDLLIELKL